MLTLFVFGVLWATAICQGRSLPFWHQSVLVSPDLQTPGTRDLELGELNFLHTTDTHGWLGSHLNQANYDADWGDFVSFTSNFKHNRVGTSRDLILIDTGDKHDGNGLSDATATNGQLSTEIFNEQDYDLLTLGNHELYTEENTVLEYYSTATSKKFRDAYVSSNVDFVTEDGRLVPFGSKFCYFKTPNRNIRILAFSFMFNFQRANARAKVTLATTALQQEWFQKAVSQYPEGEIDVIVIFGHMPITDPEEHEINQVHSIFRKHYPRTIIQYFGAHSHVRDFAVFDELSTGIQSGRFAETVGFLSIDNIKSDTPKFSRRYIDFNKNQFSHHSGSSTLTEKGVKLSHKISRIRQELNLNDVVGYVPSSYHMYSKPLSSKHNIYNLLTSKVLPNLKSDRTDESKSRFTIINTGSIRYDLYKGNFTKDTEYIVSPFPNNWTYVEVPLSLAEGVADYLNDGPVLYTSMAPPEVRRKKHYPGSCPFIHDPHLRKGYTTSDDFGCDGDDVIHNSELVFRIPNVVQSVELKRVGPEDRVHLIFYSFIQKDVLRALNDLSKNLPTHVEYTDAHCQNYGGDSTKDLLKQYVRDQQLQSHK
ncbi:LAME_0E13542g1_1 [Lachancea meyersii CBS 8951]|uniref:LAME_0E13542g1_1 n=1 Tax=Lachancea meyersii CBS 8951 TaxID=1266667 RepID=A0A1G4JM65_9SACH|nr:LAME_0E13542g1_1 [Lachancea meyersii CBS 8951]